jgi:hypothetical protein
MTAYTAFDIEIVNDLPEEDYLRNYDELGIACAAVASRNPDGQISYRTWITEGESITAKEACAIVADLQAAQQKGQTLVTVNGAGFDFRVLAAESGLNKECAELALDHVDLLFMMLARRGFPLGLDAMAKGAGVKGKLQDVRLSNGTRIDDMSCEKAPRLWRAGERDAVLAYLKDDVRATLETAEAVEKKGGIGWTD